MTQVDFWTDGVEVDRAQVWDDAYPGSIPDHAHKMGHLNRGDKVHVIELYPDGAHTWARFDDIEPAGESGLEPFGDGYNQWWVAVAAFYADDEPEDPPTEPETGFLTWLKELVRAIVRFFQGVFDG